MRYSAIVVNTMQRGPGQMTGMGNALTDLADYATGGEISNTQKQLADLQLALKLSIVASLIAGAAGLAVLLSGKAR